MFRKKEEGSKLFCFGSSLATCLLRPSYTVPSGQGRPCVHVDSAFLYAFSKTPRSFQAVIRRCTVAYDTLASISRHCMPVRSTLKMQSSSSPSPNVFGLPVLFEGHKRSTVCNRMFLNTSESFILVYAKKYFCNGSLACTVIRCKIAGIWMPACPDRQPTTMRRRSHLTHRVVARHSPSRCAS